MFACICVLACVQVRGQLGVISSLPLHESVPRTRTQVMRLGSKYLYLLSHLAKLLLWICFCCLFVCFLVLVLSLS